MGYDIVSYRSVQNRYFIADRNFELPELKMIIDSIQAAKFISPEKSENLVHKVASVTSIGQAQDLKRNLYVNKQKKENVQILFVIDQINYAINHNKQITFQYYEYNREGKLVLKYDGHRYEFSPYALVWNVDNYYVVGYSEKHNTLTSCKIDGKKVEVATDTTKTKSSRRTLPLIPQFRALLLQRWEMQEEYKRVCGSCYNTKYLEYICVDEMGNIIPPNYLSEAFPKLLARNGMRHSRFHDLRHTCASMLLKNGVPMKQIQEWLGHYDFSTTANIYAHLDYNSKLNSAEAMITGMGAALTTVS